VRQRRRWSQAANLLLRAVADIIVGGLTRHEAFTALARSEERFRTLVRRSSDVAMILDDDTGLRYLGPSAEAVLDWHVDACTGRRYLGGGQVQQFDAPMQAELLKRVELGRALRGSEERGELALHYQPVFDAHERRLLGLEARVTAALERYAIPPRLLSLEVTESSRPCPSPSATAAALRSSSPSAGRWGSPPSSVPPRRRACGNFCAPQQNPPVRP